jgi:predicted ABC-type ATPase
MTGPNLVVLGGPNGAGKTTASRRILVGPLAVDEFVNADIIAQGISAFDPESAAMQAGRVMTERLRQLTARGVSVAVETTLASKSFASMAKELATVGYQFRVVFLWLPSPDMALERVRERVLLGGHNVPEEVVRRRYEAGLRNFFRIYSPIAASWVFYDNSYKASPREVARGTCGRVELISDPELWNNIEGKWK